MDISKIKREDGKLTFTVTVDPAGFEAAVNKAYQQAKKSINVPGFRKGKAPRMVIEGMYGANVFYDDAVNALALDAYRAGLEEAKDRTVGDPAITNYDVAEDKTLSIDFEAALYPEVTLGAYKALEAYKEPVEITDADVDKELESIRKRNARIVTVDREAQNGDTVNLDFDGYKDGVPFEGGKAEGHDLVLGSGSFVPGFEEQLVGLKAGDEKALDITFPENYHADLAGAAVVFKVKINEVKESQLPALDDDFAKDVSEYDTLEEYRAGIRKELEEKKTTAAENQFRDGLMRQAIANMTVTVPEVMIEDRVNAVLQDYSRNCQAQGLTMEQYFAMMGIDVPTARGYIRPNAENEIKAELLLEKVAEVEAITVTDEEREAEYQKTADNYSMELDKVKSSIPAEMIDHDLKNRKAADLIVSTGIPTDKKETETEAPAEEKTEE